MQSDEELLAICKSGDSDAYSELWERHYRAGITAARNIAPQLDAEDLVSEAFLKIYTALASGGGPTASFRPYLYRVIRNTAAGAYRNVEITGAELETIRASDEEQPWHDDSFDRAAAARAFKSLDERWQAALWYTEVENLPPRKVAPLLGLSANGVSALANRAREALRSAWIDEHINRDRLDPECGSTLSRLQRYHRGKLTSGAHRKVEAHLGKCESCARAANEHVMLNRKLAFVLASLFVGGGAASSLLGGFGQASPASALAAGTQTDAAGTADGGASGPAGSSGISSSAAAAAGGAAGVHASAVTTAILITVAVAALGAAAAFAIAPLFETRAEGTETSKAHGETTPYAGDSVESTGRTAETRTRIANETADPHSDAAGPREAVPALGNSDAEGLRPRDPRVLPAVSGGTASGAGSGTTSSGEDTATGANSTSSANADGPSSANADGPSSANADGPSSANADGSSEGQTASAGSNPASQAQADASATAGGSASADGNASGNNDGDASAAATSAGDSEADAGAGGTANGTSSADPAASSGSVNAAATATSGSATSGPSGTSNAVANSSANGAGSGAGGGSTQGSQASSDASSSEGADADAEADPGSGSDTDPADPLLDPSLSPGFECTVDQGVPGAVHLSGTASSYGGIRARLLPAGAAAVPLILLPSVTDAQGHTFTDLLTGTDPAPLSWWWSPSITPLDQWGLGGLDLSDLTLELRLIVPDGRYSPWTAVDVSQVCSE